jgi:hypothetical protein
VDRADAAAQTIAADRGPAAFQAAEAACVPAERVDPADLQVEQEAVFPAVQVGRAADLQAGLAAAAVSPAAVSAA